MTGYTERPVLFGAPYSVYVQAARLALDEKSVDYELVPIDIFTEAGPSAEHLARHPFGKIPAFEHAGFRLYEAGAITRYIDEAFPGPPLQPVEPQARARMNQIISIADSLPIRHWSGTSMSSAYRGRPAASSRMKRRSRRRCHRPRFASERWRR